MEIKPDSGKAQIFDIQQFDQTSGNHLIRGRNAPIDKGIFRQEKGLGLVVDCDQLNKKKWFKSDREIIEHTNTGLLSLTLQLAKNRMPIGDNFSRRLAKMRNIDKGVLIGEFAIDESNGVPSANPDVQALYTALLLSLRIKNDQDRQVWVATDEDDGHAIVHYSGHSGEYKFDPSDKDSTNFVKTDPKPLIPIS